MDKLGIALPHTPAPRRVGDRACLVRASCRPDSSCDLSPCNSSWFPCAPPVAPGVFRCLPETLRSGPEVSLYGKRNDPRRGSLGRRWYMAGLVP